VEKGPEKVVVKQNKAQGEGIEIRAEAVASSWQQPNRTARFGKLDHPIYLGSMQKGASESITSRTVLAPRWCPPELTPNKKRRIQWLRAQKLREEVAEKESDEHFNTIHPMISTKQE
jgi:hypothetical protein